jgi:hypothetical protein
MNKSRFKLKVLITLGCVVFFVLPVILRQRAVRMKRERAIVSNISEWKKFGKPVFVQKIARRDMKVFTKISLMPLSKTLFEGYVTTAIQRRLIAGQTVLVDTEQGEKIVGRYVGQRLNVDTGMFQVRVATDHAFEPLHHIVVGYVHTGTIKNIISVPNEIIDVEKGKPFVWKIKDGCSFRQPIALGERNDYGAIVLQGLVDGDMVVIRGQTQLADGDKVQIADYKNM